MIVTELEYISNYRIKVFIDEEFAFILYPQDIKRYKIEEEKEISDDLFLLIKQETILRRAKNKALCYLDRTEQTERILRQKLKSKYYTEDIIDLTIIFLKNYNYLDDRRYAYQYISSYMNKKSITFMKRELYIRGISDDIIEDVVAEFCIDENSNLRIQIDKRIDNLSQFDESSKRKTINYFLRRGFNYYDIIKSIEEYHKK